MIDMRYKPYHLPQISAPYNIIVDGLDEMGVKYEEQDFIPDNLKPSQGFVFCDDFKVNDDPIWVGGESDEENIVLDGHHRWVNSLTQNKPIKGIKIFLKPKDACRVLNKVQDIYEYKDKLNLEEIMGIGGRINTRNDIDNEEYDWLTEFEKNVSSEITLENKGKKKPKKLVAYRQKPVSESSVVGNYFSLIPVNGYNKYEIEFDNLLDTKDIGVSYYSGQNPVDILVKLWYPNIDFEKESGVYNTSVENLKNRCVTERAKKMGYDGIKYGDSLLQGL